MVQYGFEIIFRSQFSNLLPILILALGIDDSLHALHRYKEERKMVKQVIRLLMNRLPEWEGLFSLLQQLPLLRS